MDGVGPPGVALRSTETLHKPYKVPGDGTTDTSPEAPSPTQGPRVPARSVHCRREEEHCPSPWVPSALEGQLS